MDLGSIRTDVDRSWLLPWGLIAAVFVVALAVRLWPLYVSSLPSTLDGFGYAALARDTIRSGSFILPRFRADNFVFTGLLVAVSLVVEGAPLRVAQPVVALTGAASCLTILVLVRRLVARHGGSQRSAWFGMGVAGLALAVNGLYARRSGTTDEEALAFLLVPLVVIAFHRALVRDERTVAWTLLTALLLVPFPILHTFSTLVAGLTVTALAALVLFRLPSRRTFAIGSVSVVGFWIYTATYYRFARRSVLSVPYVDRVTAYPGLFLAWAILMVLGVVWIQRTSSRMQRLVVGSIFGSGFAFLAINGIRPIFPGTQTTPSLVFALVAAYAVPVMIAAVGLPVVARDYRGPGDVVLALLGAPIAIVFFALTASLTPEYFDTVMRGHTFVYAPLSVLVGVAVSRLVDTTPGMAKLGGLRSGPGTGRDGTPSVDGGRGSNGLYTGRAIAFAALVLGAALVTAPLAAIHLDTATYPSTTSESQFSASLFAADHVDGPWSTDDPLTRIAAHYYPGGTTVSQRAVTNWLRGGLPPGCPTLVQGSWATSGAHLFPAPAETLPASELDAYRERNDVLYAVEGRDRVVLVRPLDGSGSGC